MDDIVSLLKRRAGELGFDAVGIAPAEEAPHWPELRAWIEAGYAGEMNYIARRLEAYRHPEALLPGCRSVIMVASAYRPDVFLPIRAGWARVASYARRRDYHQVLRERLAVLASELVKALPGVRTRVVVDTAPFLERSFAVRAGLGWIGKNTMLIHRRCGSFTLLGAILTTAALPADDPFTSDHCGNCSQCMKACPTQAIVAPRVLDARRCISYWTIEARGCPPRELRPLFGEWFFGCDVCQRVCWWNSRYLWDRLRKSDPWAGSEELSTVDAATILLSSDEGLRQRFGHLPLWRAKATGLKRNAAIVLGNSLRLAEESSPWIPKESPPPSPRSHDDQPLETSDNSRRVEIPSLLGGETMARDVLNGRPFGLGVDHNLVFRWLGAVCVALQHPAAVVRQAAAWALGCFRHPACARMLKDAYTKETNPAVREEIEAALASFASSGSPE